MSGSSASPLRLALLAIVAVLIGSFSFGLPTASGQEPGRDGTFDPVPVVSAVEHPPADPGQRPASGRGGRLDSALSAVADVARQRGSQAALEHARGNGVGVTGDRVRVIVEPAGGDLAGASDAVSRAGGQAEGEYGDLVQARLPVQALEAVSRDPSVKLVRRPFVMVPDAVSEGVALSNASAWQTAGFTGAGVKIAVIDEGFQGYAARQSGGDLPAALVTQNFRNGSGFETTKHGTAVAEIVYDMAPGAQLYLLAVETEVDLGEALQYAKSEGIHIINHSHSWYNTSRGDGSGGPGTPDAIVADARANGILWVNSAGNRARGHWSGGFSDTSGNQYHEFAGADEGNTFTLLGSQSVIVALKWDEWAGTPADYDLYLFGPGNTLLESSTDNQSVTGRPTEMVTYTNPNGSSKTLYVSIRGNGAASAARMDLFVDTKSSQLEHYVEAGSITEPGSSPNAMAAGAIDQATGNLEWFSSHGPTIDGRVKPDLAGYDNVATATYKTMLGTSAGAPHVAGAAALLKQAFPAHGPADLQAALEERAMDLGDLGKDNAYGAGKLWLGTPAGSPPPTATATPVPPTATPVPGAPLFSSGFESGNLAGFDGVFGSPQVVAEAAKNGSFGLKLSATGNTRHGVYKNVNRTANQLTTMRAWVNVVSHSNLGRTIEFEFNDGSQIRATVGFPDATHLYLYMNGLSSGQQFSPTMALAAGWHELQMVYDGTASPKRLYLLLDGAEVASLTDATGAPVGRVVWQNYPKGNSTSAVAYFDDVAWSDAVMASAALASGLSAPAVEGAGPAGRKVPGPPAESAPPPTDTPVPAAATPAVAAATPVAPAATPTPTPAGPPAKRQAGAGTNGPKP